MSIYFYLLRKIPRKYLIIFSYLMTRFTALFYTGNKYFCPICKGRFRKLMPYGVWQKRVNALCPKCLSLERHRLMWLYLQRETGFFSDSLKVLHVAPEQCFRDRFRKLKNLEYITADMESPIADVKLDVQNIPFDENTFDVVICNHVLEHVEDDKQAMEELFRITKKGGCAIIYVPIDFSRETTYEDPGIITPTDREKHFRQKDHLRLYGKDFPKKLEESGFTITEENYLDRIPEEERTKFALPKQEYMYAYKKI